MKSKKRTEHRVFKTILTMIVTIEMCCFSGVAMAAGKMERIGGDYRLQ